MEFDQINQFSDQDFDESVGVRELLEKYLIHLKWFILSVLIFGALAFLKLRYEVPLYKISSSILIKEKDKGSSYADLSSFEDLGLFGSGDNKLENEIQVLKSRKLMTKVVEELKLNTRYYIEDSPYNIELYPNFPVLINFKNDSISNENFSTNFKIIVKSSTRFDFIDFDGYSIENKTFGTDFQANLGNEYLPNKQFISIDLNDNFNEDIIGKTIFVTISPKTSIVSGYMNRVKIEPINEKLSKVLIISIDESMTKKGVALINNLVEQYNADGISDKKEIVQTTIDFLDLRIGLISTELVAIEGTAEQFKTRNRMIDVNVGSDIFLRSSSENENELVNANTQKQLANYMLEELNNSGKGELLPGNIGLSDPGILNMINEFNSLVLQRNRILKSSSVINPIIVNIDSQLDVLKNNLKGSLRTLNSSLEIKINALHNQSGKINSRIASVPKNEREYKDIVRQQETKNALYLFLLQKREESILSNAVAVEKAKIVDVAYSDGLKVSPKKKTTYLGSFILGILVPFLIIYIKDVFDTKVHTEKDIRKLKIPYLGDVPLTSSKKNLYITDYDDSNIAESFRFLRTNINFMLDSKEKGKTVFVTSTQSHEGKTFSAINLASSLAISGNKTLLLAMDLRAPKITKYLKLKDNIGVTNFIKDNSLRVEDIVKKHPKFNNLHIINSGDIPPNPVELLISNRIN